MLQKIGLSHHFHQWKLKFQLLPSIRSWIALSYTLSKSALVPLAISNTGKVIMCYSMENKYFYMSYISTKFDGICFISPIKQCELTNFLLALWLKKMHSAFHYHDCWWFLIFFFKTSYVPRLCYSQPLWGSTDRAMREVMHCHSLNKISSIRQQDFTLWCLLSTRVETKERIPKQAILLNYCVRSGEQMTVLVFLHKHFLTWINCS